MKIVNGKWPPNIQAIRSAFNIQGMPNVVYTYGKSIYVPSSKPLPLELLMHETTHSAQQEKMGPKKWWEKYLTNQAFRLEQEIEAYRAQYQVMLKRDSRQYRRFVLKHMSKDLSGRMYGNLVTREEAIKLITEEPDGREQA